MFPGVFRWKPFYYTMPKALLVVSFKYKLQVEHTRDRQGLGLLDWPWAVRAESHKKDEGISFVSFCQYMNSRTSLER